MLLTEELRQAANRSGKSANELARQARIPQTTLSRFLRGHAMNIDHASRLAAALRLRLVAANQGTNQ